jgi:hypothetical protein
MTATPPAHTRTRADARSDSSPARVPGRIHGRLCGAGGMKAAPSYTSRQDASHVRFARSASGARGRPGRFGPGPTRAYSGS